MKFIRNLSIRNKLLLVSLVLLGGPAFIFLAIDVMDKLSKQRNIHRVYNDVQEIEKASDVIHNLMEERGYSIAYAGSGGKEEKTEMLMQRGETDKAISVFWQSACNSAKE